MKPMNRVDPKRSCVERVNDDEHSKVVSKLVIGAIKSAFLGVSAILQARDFCFLHQPTTLFSYIVLICDASVMSPGHSLINETDCEVCGLY